MRELLCGKNGELQNLTEDGHIRLCVLAIALCLYEEGDNSDPGSMLGIDAFDRVMNDARRQTEEEDFTGKPDARAEEETCAHRGWWFLTLPFDKAIHGQLLATIGTKASKRKKKKKKKKKP